MKARVTLLTLLLLGGTPLQAAENCWVKAAARYGVSPWMLYAIARVESDFDPRAYEKLADSESRGIMQINSFWYPRLRELGIGPDDLWEPCTNIHVGAWIYAQEIARYGNTWTAVGAYNAGALTAKTTHWKKGIYAGYIAKMQKALRELMKARSSK